jgi:hypothetical protein
MLLLGIDLVAQDNAPSFFSADAHGTCELDCQMRQINYTITIFKTDILAMW